MFFLNRKSQRKAANEREAVSGKRLIFPLALEDGRVPGLLQNLTLITGTLVIAAVMWADAAEIRELAVGRGEVVPSGAVKSVHHLEGGIIEEVLAEEGQIVEAGAPLMRLRPTAAASDLQQLRVRATILEMQKKRLVALLRGYRFLTDSTMAQHPRLAEDQLELYKAQLSLRQHEERTLQARIEQRSADLDALGKETKSLERQLEITRDRVESLQKLHTKKLVARTALQEAMTDHEQTVARHIALTGRRNAALTAVDEARSLQLEAKVQFRKQLTEELAEVSGKLAELKQSIAKQRDLVERLHVRSPTHGTVQHLPFRSQGEVIKPGALVAKVVPVGDTIVAEVRLDPKDIGHVKVGDPADIKVSTFDPNVFGIVPGRVNRLSASTFQSERGEIYYKAIIALERNVVGQEEDGHKITPGMIVQADIVTGAKSLVQYMLKPVYSSLNTAFTER